MVNVKDKEFLSLFWDLSANNDVKRLNALEKLYVLISEKQNASKDEICDEMKYSVSRLISGLASSRKTARIGFSTLLTNLLQSFDTPSTGDVISTMDEKLKISCKNESKDLYFGQIFGLLILLKSGRLADDDDVLMTSLKKSLNLAERKSYLNPITLHFIQLVIKQMNAEKFKSVIWPTIQFLFANGWNDVTADVIETLQLCHQKHPEICSKKFLLDSKWIPKKSSKLIGSHSNKHLTKLIAETTRHHPIIHQFAYDVIKSHPKLGDFWEKSLCSALMTSSPERKYLGLKLAMESLKEIKSKNEIEQIWSRDILASIQSAANSKNPLHLYIQKSFSKELVEIFQQLSADLQFHFLLRLLNMKSSTKSPLMSQIVANLNIGAMTSYISWLKQLFASGKSEELGDDVIANRKWALKSLTQMTRMTSLTRSEDWILSSAKFVAFHAFFKDATSEVQSEFVVMETLADETVNDVISSFFNLVSWLSSMPSIPMTSSTQVTSSQPLGVMSDGSSWLFRMTSFINKVMTSLSDDDVTKIRESKHESWDQCWLEISRMQKLIDEKKSTEARAFQLLLLHLSLQLLKRGNDESSDDVTSDSTIDDVIAIIRKRFPVKKKKNNKKKDDDDDVTNDPPWIEVLVEILLNFLSKSSRSLRVIVNQVFRLMTSHMTSSSLQLILDVFEMKPEKDQNQDEEQDQDEDEDQDESQKDDEDQEEDDEESSDDDDEDDDDEDDDVTDEQFRKKVKEALGDAAISSDEEEKDERSDDEDFDDETMMKIDPLIAAVFQQRSQMKKREKKSFGIEKIHFQIRCLDLLEIFISTAHYSHLVFKLPLPLLQLIRSSSKHRDQSNLAEKAALLLKMKICKWKKVAKTFSDDDVIDMHATLFELIARFREGGGVFLSKMTSQCCLLFIRVLMTSQRLDSKALEDLLLKLLDDFMMRRDNRIQTSIFQQLAHSQPVMTSSFLARPLLKYMREACQVYKKMQAAQLVTSLIAHSSISLKEVADDVISIFNSQQADDAVKLKPKFLVKVAKLLDVATLKLKASKEESDSIIASMTSYFELDAVKSSQELKNLLKKVLRNLEK